ncbi:MAG: fimbria/pilus outer membrane usher protein, partial [Acidobacteria bacterium]|nr:fimbria/pilus outer membrane usher protein [Acidobacteriota bacterium]
VSGAIVGVGGHLFATRPVNDAFALVRIPDAHGVRVYSTNQLMGRTNGNGDLIIPDVISYYGNDLAIDPADLPLTLNPLRDRALVAPSFRAGGLAMFGISKMNPVVGRVVIVSDSSSIVPASGDLFVAGAPGSRSPIGNDGAFFFDGIEPGPAKLIGRYKGRAFTCHVRVPPVTASLVRDLGLVRCVQNEDDSSPEVVPQ